jgi:hypothetical protein
LQKAAQDGELDVALAGQFYTRPELALQQIPYDIRQKYNIPETLTGAVEKSGTTPDEPLSLRQIRARLLRAAQCGAIDPQFLGMFDAHPDRALRALPYDVRKSYGLPAQLEETLRKSYAPVSSDGEVYVRLGDAISASDVSGYLRQRWLRGEGRRVLHDIPATIRKQYGLPSE